MNNLFNTVHNLPALAVAKMLPDESINCVVTSPPYFGARDYGIEGQYGRETTIQDYVGNLVTLFDELRRVLTKDGTVWLNLGDSYASDSKWGGSTGGKHVTQLHGNSGIGRDKKSTGLPDKNLIGIPWRVAFALQDAGWWLRSEIIWHKPNPMPGSQKDRPTSAHETIFLLTKSGKPNFWVHRDKGIYDGFCNQRTKPSPDYRWVNNDTNEEVSTPPENWKQTNWRRINLWESRDYYYDIDAVKTPVKPHSIKRLGRAVSATHKMANGAPGQTPHGISHARKNTNKQDGAGNRTYNGFNERYDHEENPMATLRDVWVMPTAQYRGGHFAVFPLELPRRCIALGCPPNGIVMDPFMGTGTTAEAAVKLGRQYVGAELNPAYINECNTRLGKPMQLDLTGIPLFAQAVTL